MKYFLDTEFIETVGHIELISIGIVAEDGREYYAVNADAKLGEAGEWVRENVLLRMPEYKKGIPGHFVNLTKHLSAVEDIREMILQLTAGDPNIEFYGYFSDYDWVVFCWIFGTMMQLPKGFPMYCLDLKQMMKERGLTKEWKQQNCPDPEGEHNALVDARWNKKLYEKIISSSTIHWPSEEEVDAAFDVWINTQNPEDPEDLVGGIIWEAAINWLKSLQSSNIKEVK